MSASMCEGARGGVSGRWSKRGRGLLAAAPPLGLLALALLGCCVLGAAVRPPGPELDAAGGEGARRRHAGRVHRSHLQQQQQARYHPQPEHHNHHHHHQHHHHHHQHTLRFHSGLAAGPAAELAAADVWGSKLGSGRSQNAVLPGASKPATQPPPQPPPPIGATDAPEPQGFFLSENCTVVLAQTGSTPVLHCEVADLGEGTVSWIRRKDYHLLTVGLATYSSDDRFFTAHVRSAQDWALHVRFATAQDAGLYECQVSSHPPSSLFTELQLVEARAEVLGGADKFVKSGSELRLTCLLRHSTEPPQYVFWYHERAMINYALERGVSVRHGRSSSEMVIAAASNGDSGNYTCAPSNARPASISVHVLNGEEPAAMQHGSKSSAAAAAAGANRGPLTGRDAAGRAALAALAAALALCSR